VLFFRIVASNPPTLDDFVSNEAQGRQLRNPSPNAARRWAGLSVFVTEEQARRMARLRRRLGRFIAAIEISESEQIRWEHTTGAPGHHTLWGEPAELARRVRSVVPV